MRSKLAILALTLALPFAASAHPQRGDDGAPGQQAPDPARVEARLHSQHARLVAELASSLNLDDASIVKLGQRLRKFDDQRVQLRMKQFELGRQLRGIVKGEAKGDVASLARELAHGRVELAQVNEQELNEVLQGLSPENATKAVQAIHRTIGEGRGEMGRGFRHQR